LVCPLDPVGVPPDPVVVGPRTRVGLRRSRPSLLLKSRWALVGLSPSPSLRLGDDFARDTAGLAAGYWTTTQSWHSVCPLFWRPMDRAGRLWSSPSSVSTRYWIRLHLHAHSFGTRKGEGRLHGLASCRARGGKPTHALGPHQGTGQNRRSKNPSHKIKFSTTPASKRLVAPQVAQTRVCAKGPARYTMVLAVDGDPARHPPFIVKSRITGASGGTA